MIFSTASCLQSDNGVSTSNTLAEASTTECDEGSNPVEYSKSLAPSFFSMQSYARIICGTQFGGARTRFVYFSKITWPLGKGEESRRQKTNNQQHKQAACKTTSTGRCVHRTAHFSGSEDSRSLYTAVCFSAFRRMRLTHSAVVSKAHLKICNLNEVTTPARKN